MRLVWEELLRNGLLFGGAFPRGVLLGGASLGGAKEVCMLSGATAIRTPSGPIFLWNQHSGNRDKLACCQ